MKYIIISLLLFVPIAYAEDPETPPAMPLSEQEHYAQLMHAKQLLEQIDAQLNVTVTDKENHCMKAIGNQEFCGCFARNAPTNVSFTKYVEFFGFGSDEFDYQKLSPAGKTLYDNIRKTRDKCVNWKGKDAH